MMINVRPLIYINNLNLTIHATGIIAINLLRRTNLNGTKVLLSVIPSFSFTFWTRFKHNVIIRHDDDNTFL